jgi:hypothetical protein
MRTSFHHQPEAQHPNFQLSTSWQADYPIFRRAVRRRARSRIRAPSGLGGAPQDHRRRSEYVRACRDPRLNHVPNWGTVADQA